MKCPICHEAGRLLKTDVTKDGSSLPYEDADGGKHLHDYNYITTYYQCTHGHRWYTTSHRPCPLRECGWPHNPPRTTVQPDEGFRQF